MPNEKRFINIPKPGQAVLPDRKKPGPKVNPIQDLKYKVESLSEEKRRHIQEQGVSQPSTMSTWWKQGLQSLERQNRSYSPVSPTRESAVSGFDGVEIEIVRWN
ncbi:hypothetical protein FOTG_19128 [Fusarium oxysporum f. sp. vasinfectum 25433]|uniref:Uncharacterized protein n=1 Tax=Fusarium oxysporum f. sp. vasinfectum 25433 TaxID=1089449 RepID=X0KUM9_FUSOX|nr:hypothetical protein FOTG_19128 [Fusarium oxysporum f. sp. vasinfectum 25433]